MEGDFPGGPRRGRGGCHFHRGRGGPGDGGETTGYWQDQGPGFGPRGGGRRRGRGGFDRGRMEGLLDEFAAMKDSIAQLEVRYSQDIDGLKEENWLQSEKIANLQKQNASLQKQVSVLQPDGTHGEFGLDDAEKNSNVVKKVDRMEQTVAEMKVQFTDGMRTMRNNASTMQDNSSKMQEYCDRQDKIQKVFNLLHLSTQSRKDLEKEVEILKGEVDTLKSQCQPDVQASPETQTKETELQQATSNTSPISKPEPPQATRHPSKRAMSNSDANKMVKEPSFKALMEEIALQEVVTIFVDDYTKVEQPCDYMDAKSGVYTVPVKGEYEFGINAVALEKAYIYLCRDREELQAEFKYVYDPWKCCFVYPVIKWKCEENDKIWIEMKGLARDNIVNGLQFSGALINLD